jgi:hypothetical protein
MTQPTLAAAPQPKAAPTPPATEPTHPCIRCGRPVADPAAGLCETCNPLELAQPSATQVHGIAAFGIVAFVVVLAVAAHLALSGTGPFTGTVAGVTAAAGGLNVTLTVHNAGTKAGATTCRITAVGQSVGPGGDLVQTPPVPAGSDLTFTTFVTQLGATPIGIVADCVSP